MFGMTSSDTAITITIVTIALCFTTIRIVRTLKGQNSNGYYSGPDKDNTDAPADKS